MENEKEWIAVNDLSKKIEVSENTLKRYIRRHEQFLKIKQGNRSKYFYSFGFYKKNRETDKENVQQQYERRGSK
ncbi:hypothetical protein GCM10020331_011980 [Ectobacillus funiculus]